MSGVIPLFPHITPYGVGGTPLPSPKLVPRLAYTWEAREPIMLIKIFRDFFQFLPLSARIARLIKPRPICPHSFQFFIRLSSNNSTPHILSSDTVIKSQINISASNVHEVYSGLKS